MQNMSIAFGLLCAFSIITASLVAGPVHSRPKQTNNAISSVQYHFSKDFLQQCSQALSLLDRFEQSEEKAKKQLTVSENGSIWIEASQVKDVVVLDINRYLAGQAELLSPEQNAQVQQNEVLSRDERRAFICCLAYLKRN